jgi:formiminoglutamase
MEYIRSKGGKAVFADRTSCDRISDRLMKLTGGEDDGSGVMLTLDMDAVDQSDAPGVSAPNVSGLPKSVLLETARLAGGNSRVSSMDLVEVNPFFDRDDQTSRLGALVYGIFCWGCATGRTLDAGQ